MPGTNPLLDAADGSGVVYAPSVETLIDQDPRPGALAGSIAMNSTAGTAATQVNAAGTSENVNIHIAVLIALLLGGVYGLNKLGFKFAATGSVGFGR